MEAHAFGNNVAFSDAKAALACRKRHALFYHRKFLLRKKRFVKGASACRK